MKEKFLTCGTFAKICGIEKHVLFIMMKLIYLNQFMLMKKDIVIILITNMILLK